MRDLARRRDLLDRIQLRFMPPVQLGAHLRHQSRLGHRVLIGIGLSESLVGYFRETPERLREVKTRLPAFRLLISASTGLEMTDLAIVRHSELGTERLLCP